MLQNLQKQPKIGKLGSPSKNISSHFAPEVANKGVGDGAKGAVAPPPNSGEKVFFGQTSCNIRAVDILTTEGRTGTLYF